MGLTTEERIKGIYHGIRNIEDAVSELQKDYHDDFEKLLSLCDMIWPEFLAHNSNSLMFLLGTGDFDVEQKASTPFQVALQIYTDMNIFKKDDCDEDDETKEFYNFIKDALTIEKVFGKHSFKGVFKIYECAERILFYYIRRYDDDFSKSMKPLSDLLSKIIGTCYKMFVGNDIFLRVYLTYQLWNKVIKTNYIIKHDFMNKWIHEHYINHYMIYVPDQNLKSLFNLWGQVQFKDLTIEDRLLLAMKLLSRRYYEINDHERLLNEIEQHNKVGECLIDIYKVKTALQKCTDDYNALQENLKKSVDDPECYLTNQSKKYPNEIYMDEED